MPTIDTPRLRIFSLSLDQLRLWAEDLPALERELGYAYRGVPIEERPLRENSPAPPAALLHRLDAGPEGGPGHHRLRRL